MWIFSEEAYLSVVEDKTNPDMLLVRARVKGDIEKHFPDSITTETPDADYLYRASIPQISKTASKTTVEPSSTLKSGPRCTRCRMS